MITDGYENNVTFPDINGEHSLLRKMIHHNLNTVFDVGANIGEYTKFINEISPDTKIFSFEVCEPIFSLLKKNVGSLMGVHIENIGLSDFTGTVNVNYFPNMAVITNIVDVEDAYSLSLGSKMESITPVSMLGNVVTGDQFCHEHNIQNIDFLKIDVEGAEHSVLNGFSDMLSKRRVRVMQIEYGLGNISSGFLLKDIYKFFDDRNYRIGKLRKNGVDFSPYIPTMENFRVSNFVAVLDSEKDLLLDLSIDDV